MSPRHVLDTMLRLHTFVMDSPAISLMETKMMHLRQEIRFQQTVFMFFQNFIASNHGDMSDPIEEADMDVNGNLDVLDLKQWDFVLSRCLEEREEEDLKVVCLEVLCRIYGKESSISTSELIIAILSILKVLVILKPNGIALMKEQVQSLEKMLEFVFTISWFVETTKFDQKLQNFFEYFQPWVTSAAVVPFVFWGDEMDEKLCAMLSSFLKKFNPSTSELVELYLGAIKELSEESKELEELQDESEVVEFYPGAIKEVKSSEESQKSEEESDESEELQESQECKVLWMRDALWRFIDIFQENIIVSTNDRFEMVSEGLIFLIAFLMDPPQAYAEDEKLRLTQTNHRVDEAASLICLLGKLREDIGEGRDTFLHDFLEKINRAKTELRQLHVEIPGLSWNNVPNEQSGIF